MIDLSKVDLVALAAQAPWPPDPASRRYGPSYIHESSGRLPERVLARLREMPSFEEMSTAHAEKFPLSKNHRIRPECTYIPEVWPPKPEQPYVAFSLATDSGLFSFARETVKTSKTVKDHTNSQSFSQVQGKFVFEFENPDNRDLSIYWRDGQAAFTLSRAGLRSAFVASDEDVAALKDVFGDDIQQAEAELINNPIDSFNIIGTKAPIDCIDFGKSNLKFVKETHGIYSIKMNLLDGGLVLNEDALAGARLFRVKHLSHLMFARADLVQVFEDRTVSSVDIRKVAGDSVFDHQNF